MEVWQRGDLLAQRGGDPGAAGGLTDAAPVSETQGHWEGWMCEVLCAVGGVDVFLLDLGWRWVCESFRGSVQIDGRMESLRDTRQ